MESLKIGFVEFAIPFFFLLIGIEILISYFLKEKNYRFNDSIADLSCGITEQVVEVFIKMLLMFSYIHIYNNYRILEIDNKSILSWIICFLGVDFLYYWFHRMSHEVNVIWGGHITHHQSEEYNLTVALRQGTFQSSFSWIFYLPLALIGFSPIMYLSCFELNLIYQFWIHTRVIKKLGFVEVFMNTPSHHRVHHGKNPEYLDKNYAGVLIIWDKIFGTFEPEVSEPVYGTVKPCNSWNPIWTNIYHWIDIYNNSKQIEKFSDKVKIWFMKPGWLPDSLKKSSEIYMFSNNNEKFDPNIPKNLNIYVLFQFIPTLIFTVKFLEIEQNLEIVTKFIFGFVILLSLFNIGGILEGKKWVLFSEISKFILALSIIFYFLPLLSLPILIFTLISTFWLINNRSFLLKNILSEN